MKNTLIKILKVVLPVAFGIGLFYYFFQIKLTEEQRSEMIQNMVDADYGWIGISMALGLISHFSRAARWNLLISSSGYVTSFWRAFLALMVGYFANLFLPRVGEAARCGVLSKQTHVPFAKLFGTVIAERALDMMVLLTIAGVTFISQIELLSGIVNEYIVENVVKKFENLPILIPALGGIALIALAWWAVRKLKSMGKFDFIDQLLASFRQGIQSIFKVKKPGLFIMHTVIIWVLYLLMFGICFQAIEATQLASVASMFSSFFMGSIGIIIVPGGIGVYPVLIQKTLELYQIDPDGGLALGSIIWASQTLLLLVIGGFAFLGLFLTSPLPAAKDE